MARAATGTTGGAAGSWRDAEHIGRGPDNARGDLATWGGKSRGIAGWGRRGARTGSHTGKPGRVGRGWRVKDESVSAGQREEVNLDNLSAAVSGGKQGEKAVACASSAASS